MLPILKFRASALSSIHRLLRLGAASQIPSPESSPSALLSQTDRDLYLAKERGRNRAAVFDGKL